MNTSSGPLDLTYRLATDKDMDVVYDLYMDETSNPYLTYDNMDKKDFEKIYYALLSTTSLYVVEIGNQVIGSYRLIPKTHRQAHTVYLGSFVVEHSMKGRGIGSKILNHIKAFAIQQGTARIELTVDIENEAAINLYRKIGFEIEGRIKKSYSRNCNGIYYDEYLMGLIV